MDVSGRKHAQSNWGLLDGIADCGLAVLLEAEVSRGECPSGSDDVCAGVGGGDGPLARAVGDGNGGALKVGAAHR